MTRMPTAPSAVAYRGYLICPPVPGDAAYYVTRDGFLICWARSPEMARTLIDQVAD